MERLEKLLFALIRQALGLEQGVSVEDDLIPTLYAMAYRHELAHLVAYGLGTGCCLSGGFQERLLEAHYRYERYAHAYEELSQRFEKEKLPFVPLKGQVLREFYPEPWMRTGCDLDLLVRQEDLERAGKLLESDMGYGPKAISGHDISFISGDGVRVELHHTLIEGNEVLRDIWDHCAQGQMEPEYLYLYHIAHAAKHLRHGGCGIRPVLDLWLMERQGITCADALLEQCGLLTFAKALSRLSRCWFETGQVEEALRPLHCYILQGGIFGTAQSVEALRRDFDKKRLFISKKELEYAYPILRKRGWLLPVCQLRRWCRLLRSGQLRAAHQPLRPTAEALMNQLELPTHRG